MINTSSFELRPHHVLCIRFFAGEGYSQRFVDNMKGVIDRLERENPLLQLTGGDDMLCRCCPHLQKGVCRSHEKVHCFDTAVLSLCGLSFGDCLSWRELQALTEGQILQKGKLSAVCRDCEWSRLCLPLEQDQSHVLFPPLQD